MNQTDGLSRGLAALAYAQAEHEVIPLHWTNDAGHCSCGARDCKSPGKHPLTAHGLKDASNDPTRITGWWKRWPEANIGIRTGVITVLDIDDTALASAMAAHPELLRNYPIRRTPRGGLHIEILGNARSRGLTRDDGSKVGDLKGEGGYVLVPPSRIGTGRYEDLNDVAPPTVADVDRSVTEVLLYFGVRLSDGSSRRGHLAVAEILQNLGEGSRNIDLTSIAGKLRRDGWSRADIYTLLEPHADRCGLDHLELWHICTSVGRYQPRPGARGPIHVA